MQKALWCHTGSKTCYNTLQHSAHPFSTAVWGLVSLCTEEICAESDLKVCVKGIRDLNQFLSLSLFYTGNVHFLFFSVSVQTLIRISTETNLFCPIMHCAVPCLLNVTWLISADYVYKSLFPSHSEIKKKPSVSWTWFFEKHLSLAPWGRRQSRRRACYGSAAALQTDSHFRAQILQYKGNTWETHHHQASSQRSLLAPRTACMRQWRLAQRFLCVLEIKSHVIYIQLISRHAQGRWL